MRDGFTSRAFSVAVSAFLAGILFLSLPPKVDRDRAPKLIDEMVADTSSVEPAPGVSYADAPTGMASVALPPPPVRSPTAAEQAISTVPESPSAAAAPTITIEPLHPSIEMTTLTSVEAIEPLRPSSTPDTRPAETLPEPLQPRATDEVSPQPRSEPNVDRTVEPGPGREPTDRLDSATLPDKSLIAEGRVLLRILEHGSGPTVEITWPVGRDERRRLYRRFEACFGMQFVLMDADGRLFAMRGEPGQPWDPNLDRYSGFVRQTNGPLTTDEHRYVQDLRTFHHGLAGAYPVRIFPRRVDALLLGGLRHLVGGGYEHATSIPATYRVDGGRVLVEAIESDGRPVQGYVDLSRAAKSSCDDRGLT